MHLASRRIAVLNFATAICRTNRPRAHASGCAAQRSCPSVAARYAESPPLPAGSCPDPAHRPAESETLAAPLEPRKPRNRIRLVPVHVAHHQRALAIRHRQVRRELAAIQNRIAIRAMLPESASIFRSSIRLIRPDFSITGFAFSVSPRSSYVTLRNRRTRAHPYTATAGCAARRRRSSHCPARRQRRRTSRAVGRLRNRILLALAKDRVLPVSHPHLHIIQRPRVARVQPQVQRNRRRSRDPGLQQPPAKDPNQVR